MTEQGIRRTLALLKCSVPLRAPKGWMVCACPFAYDRHVKGVDRNPSFSIHINNHGFSGWHCWSCHEKGNMLKLVHDLAEMRGENLDHIAAIVMALEVPHEFEDFDAEGTVLHACANLELDPVLYFSMYALAWEHPLSRAYLIKRGISEETSMLLDLRYDPERRRVMFPVFGHGKKLYGFQGRAIDDLAKAKTYNYPPMHSGSVLLGEHLMRPGFDKVVVEGLFAYAHLVEIGARKFCDPVATLGSAMSTVQAGKLIEKGEHVHLLYDDDDAGTLGIYGAWDARLQKYRGGGAYSLLEGEVIVHVPDYPQRTGDPDDLTAQELYEMLFV